MIFCLTKGGVIFSISSSYPSCKTLRYLSARSATFLFFLPWSLVFFFFLQAGGEGLVPGASAVFLGVWGTWKQSFNRRMSVGFYHLNLQCCCSYKWLHANQCSLEFNKAVKPNHNLLYSSAGELKTLQVTGKGSISIHAFMRWFSSASSYASVTWEMKWVARKKGSKDTFKICSKIKLIRFVILLLQVPNLLD